MTTEDHHLPDLLHDLFCDASLVNGEDAAVYAKLYAQVEDMVQPRDLFDQMTVSDITNRFWEQQRIRRCSAFIINAARRRALVELLSPIVGNRIEEAERLANIYFVTKTEESMSWVVIPGKPEFKEDVIEKREQVIALLAKHGVDEAAINLKATHMSVSALASCEDLIGKYEIRRAALLREMAGRPDQRQAHQANKIPARPNVNELLLEKAPSLTGAPA